VGKLRIILHILILKLLKLTLYIFIITIRYPTNQVVKLFYSFNYFFVNNFYFAYMFSVPFMAMTFFFDSENSVFFTNYKLQLVI